MNLRHILCLAALVAAGCSRSNPEIDAKLAQQDAAIKKLEGQVADLQRQAGAAVSEQRLSEVQRYSREVGLTQKDVLRTLRQQAGQIEDVRAAVDKLSATPAVAVADTATAADASAPASPVRKSNKEGFYSPVSVYAPPDPVVADFIQPPQGASADRFPVSITGVHSAKVVTGTNTTAQLVPTTNTVVDEYGDKVAKMEMREVALEEYDYQVGFAAQNLTRTPKTLTVSAGRESKSVTLQAGEATSNLTVTATYGSALSVRAGGEVRRFEVSYDD